MQLRIRFPRTAMMTMLTDEEATEIYAECLWWGVAKLQTKPKGSMTLP